jgi:hypothetical protein
MPLESGTNRRFSYRTIGDRPATGNAKFYFCPTRRWQPKVDALGMLRYGSPLLILVFTALQMELAPR